MALLWEALRQVAFLLDKVAYGFIPAVYELIFYLANVNLANQDIFVAIIERIYLLLGIFMLFRVSFSILQYIVDPGSFSDKSKGFGKLVTNTLVVIILLAATPWIFSTAYDLQNKIIMSNVIPRLILGDTSYVDNSGMTADSIDKDAIKDQQASVHSMAVDLQFAIYGAFFTLNVDPGNKAGYEGTACDPKKLEKDGNPHPNANAFGSKDMVDSECLSEIENELSKELTSHGAKLSGLYKYYDKNDSDSNSKGIVDHRDFNTFGSLLWWRKNGGDGLSDFTINYMPIVSAVVGAYLLLLLITFAIDIAVRVFKLMFLQAVAPIAIVSYIDPKESASNGRLHNWGMECLRTYFSLFLRLAIIYLAIFLVKLLISVFIDTALEGQSTMYYNGIAPEGNLNIFVFIMLVLGIFTFAKKVPQMIEGIFGIKMSGEMHLNPFKAIGENAGATALIGGTLGLGAAAASGIGMAGRLYGQSLIGGNKEMVAAAKRGDWSGAASAFWRNTKNVGRAIGGVATGTASGALVGAGRGLRSQGKGYVRAGLGQGGRVSWNMYEHDQYRGDNLMESLTGLGARARNRFSDMTGSPRDFFVDNQNIEAYKGTHGAVEAWEKAVDGDVQGQANSGNHFAEEWLIAQQRVAAQQQTYQDLVERASQGETQVNGISINDLLDETRQHIVDRQRDASAARTAYRRDMAARNQYGFDTVLEDVNHRIAENQSVDGFAGQQRITSYDEMHAFDGRIQQQQRTVERDRIHRANAREEALEARKGQVGFRKSNQR